MQPGSLQAYQNDRQTFRLVSGHYTPLNHSQVHQGWERTPPASGHQTQVSAHSVGNTLVFELTSISYDLPNLTRPSLPMLVALDWPNRY